jgi:hypothetical protein
MNMKYVGIVGLDCVGLALAIEFGEAILTKG